MGRERVEDLGRLAEILNTALEHELFRKCEVDMSRFISQMRDADDAEQIYCLIDLVREILNQARSIARWGDDSED